MYPFEGYLTLCLIQLLIIMVLVYRYYKNKINQGEVIKTLNNRLSHMNEIVSVLDEIIWHYDYKVKSWWVHDRFYDLIGYKATDFIDKAKMLDLIDGDDLQRLIGIFKSISKDTQTIKQTIRVKHKNGTDLWIYLVANIIYDAYGQKDHVAGGFMNITNIIATENTLKETYKAMKELTVIKESFLARMSHEVRTPLNAIDGYTQLLHRKLQDETLKEYSTTILNSSKQLVEVMNHIIDAGRLEAGELEISKEPINLGELYSQLEGNFKELAEDKHLTFVVDNDEIQNMLIMSDEVRLNQILFNLIANAINYTDVGFVRVSAEVNKYAFGKVLVTFTVEDSGIGISNKKIVDYINHTDNFAALNLAAENGLGLSIVYNLVHLMNGTIGVSTCPGMGTSFRISFKFTLAKEKAIGEGELVPKAQEVWESVYDSQASILIAEDNKVNQMLIEDMLRMAGLANLTLADDGLMALEAAKTKRFDLILSDIQMPNMDGIDLTKNIRRLNHDVPIIALTANVLEDQLSQYFEAGMNGYVAKPLNMGNLKEVLDKYIQHQSVMQRG